MLQGYVDTAIDDFRRCSSWQSRLNLATLHLIEGNMQGALSAMAALIDYHCEEFVRAVAGQTYSEDAAHLRHRYIESLATEAAAAELYSQLVGTGVPTSMLDELRSLAVDEPTAIIEKEIAAAKAVDNNNAEAQLEAGKRLSNNTHKARIQLQKLIGDNDPRYSRLVDKLANQILQCSINYFNKIDGENRAIVENALKLGEYALKIAVGKMARDHIQHNVDILRKKKENLPPAEVEQEYFAIMAALSTFVEQPDLIKHSVTLLNTTKPHLQSMKVKLGATNTTYIKLSSLVVNNALHNLIEEVNNSQKTDLFLVQPNINEVKRAVGAAWNATLLMDTFDMEPTLRQRYNTQKDTLKGLCEQLGIKTGEISKGCVFGMIPILIGGIIGLIIGANNDDAGVGFLVGCGIGVWLGGYSLYDNFKNKYF